MPALGLKMECECPVSAAGPLDPKGVIEYSAWLAGAFLAAHCSVIRRPTLGLPYTVQTHRMLTLHFTTDAFAYILVDVPVESDVNRLVFHY